MLVDEMIISDCQVVTSESAAAAWRHDGSADGGGAGRAGQQARAAGAGLPDRVRHGESCLVLQIYPSVPQPVVQSRRRPLLGPSPG